MHHTDVIIEMPEEDFYYNPQSIPKLIDYALRDKLALEKGVDKRVDIYGGLNVIPEYAIPAFQYVKYYFNATEGEQFKHIIVSFRKYVPPSFVEAMAYKIGYCFARKYQVVFGVHKDAENSIHIHYIINTTNFHDGSRLVFNEGDILELRHRIFSIASRYVC